MQDSEKRAVRRTLAAEDLADETDAAIQMTGRGDYVQVSARFHLLAHDAGIDLADPEDVAFTAAVLFAMSKTSPILQAAFVGAVLDTVDCYRQATA